MENKFNVKVGDVVKVNSGYSFDPAIGEVVHIGDDLVRVKITSASKDYYKRFTKYNWNWVYLFSEIVEVISRADEPQLKEGEHQ